MKKTFILVAVLTLFCSCGARTTQEQETDDGLTAWQRDSVLRVELESADHSSLDSLLTVRLGEPAKCISYLRDYCKVGDDYWYVNLSFDMALQLPEGFMPDECSNLGMVSHGARIANPDSPIVIYVSAWYDVLTEDEREDILKLRREERPDEYIRQVVVQGIEYTLTVENWKDSKPEFEAMLPYLEHFPEGPHGVISQK